MDTTTLSFPNYRVSGMAVRRKHNAKRPEPLWAEHKMLKSTEIAAERTEIACAEEKCVLCGQGIFKFVHVHNLFDGALQALLWNPLDHSKYDSNSREHPDLGWGSMDGTAFCLVTATTGTKFSMLHSITFKPFENLGVSLDGHEKESPSSLHSLPNDSTDCESFTKSTHG